VIVPVFDFFEISTDAGGTRAQLTLTIAGAA
jgi:hypothetical protein